MTQPTDHVAETDATDFATLSNNARKFISQGNYVDSIAVSNKILELHPRRPQGYLLKSRSLIAMGDIDLALRCLDEGIEKFQSNQKLNATARNFAILYGYFERGVEYGLRVSDLAPDDIKNRIFLFNAYVGSKKFDSAASLLEKGFEKEAPPAQILKLRKYFAERQKIKLDMPVLADAWEASLGDQSESPIVVDPKRTVGTIPVIQYWSQGDPPDDVKLVVNRWNEILWAENLGPISLFSRETADIWIQQNAPQFSEAFSKAFHYAMESDIFRLAYASRGACIYIDIDCWPLKNTVQMLKSGVQTGSSILYFRSYRPWLVNGLFLSSPSCPFFIELLRQCADVSFDDMPKNNRTIEYTFGPTRFNAVLHKIVRQYEGSIVIEDSGIPGSSSIVVAGHKILITHDASIASVKPPFALGYKSTEDNWKTA